MKIHFSFILVICFFTLSCKDSPKDSIEKTDVAVSLVAAIKNPAATDSQTPKLFSNGKTLFMSWVTLSDSIDHLNYASYENNSWSPPEMIASGDDWFTNWADFPAIAENKGSLLTSYLQKSDEGTYTYDVKLNYKNRDSTSWKKNFILHKDGTKTEHGFVSMIPTYDTNEFFVTWLDGRNTGASEHSGHEKQGHTSSGAMTLRGASIDKTGNVIHSKELDHSICDCCQTSAAMTVNGPIVVYRDRTEDEIRDISIVRWQNNDTWTSPKSIYKDNWKIAGCPVNGPAVDAFGKNVAVAWFTGVNETPKVQLLFSKDSGESFGTPIHVNTKQTLGRVDVIVLNETEAVISWMERDEDDTAYVQLAKISSSGEKGATVTITKTKGSRATGFPQIEFLDGNIYAAMTLLGDNNVPEIKTYRINVTDL
ncbi:MAG: hypothetical protein ACI849_000938 [Patiriisocius sp.]|jgi:hypothetical protein